MNPYLLNKDEIQSLDSLELSFHYTAEADEFWSYVGRKRPNNVGLGMQWTRIQELS